MAIYTQKYQQKLLKINNGGGGWNKDVPGGKKMEKLTIGGDDYSGLESTWFYKCLSTSNT